MSKRIQFVGSVRARNANGETMEHLYSGSYSEHVLDQSGLLPFDLEVVVDGAGSKPEPRNVSVRMPGTDIASESVTHRVETAIVEHLEGRNLDHVALL